MAPSKALIRPCTPRAPFHLSTHSNCAKAALGSCLGCTEVRQDSRPGVNFGRDQHKVQGGNCDPTLLEMGVSRVA